MNHSYTKVLLTLFFISCFSVVNAQIASRPSSFQLKNRTVVLSADLVQLWKQFQSTGRKDGLMAYVQLAGATTSLPAGLQIEQFFPSGVYIVYFSNNISEEDLKNSSIIAWAPVETADKISGWWQNSTADSMAVQNILVAARKGMGAESLSQKISAWNATLNPVQPWKAGGIWKVQIPFGKIKELAAMPFIRYIQPVFKDQVLNQQAIGFTNTEIAHQPVSLGGYNLKGTGVTIGVGDNADPLHIDYIDRVRSFNPAFANTHGTHTVGTVGGNGIKDEREKGFAPECNLISDFFSQIISNAALYNDNFGMVLTNNSYAMILGDCNYAGTYDLYSQYLDQQAFDLPDLLNIFAAANDGSITCSPFPLGYATVTGSYSTAKNVLTVGNIGKTRDIFNQSTSCGPVKDGRLKPEITAVGTDLVSTYTHNTYRGASGTSMATPNVTGAAGLLYQRFRQLHTGQNPDNALVKNVLMNGADDIATPGPDFRYGFGLMNIGHSLRILDSNRYFSNQISTGQTQSVSITIPPQTARAKIMLNWNDPAAAPNSAQTLINDLDISVTGPGNSQYLPLVLDPAAAHVTQPAQPGPDHINNVEQVVLDHPTAGTYSIHIKGYNVPQASQKYFVSYDFDPEGIRMQFPFGGEAFAAGDTTYIYWEASQGAQNFSLSYSTDNGGTWEILDNNINAGNRAFLWYIPDTIASTECIMRIERDGSTALSRPFTILGRPDATLRPAATQCPGSIKFTWNAITGVSQYRIFKKEGPEMIPVAQTPDTFYTITGLSPDSTYWIAVASVLNGSTGLRSIALSYQPNQGNCSEITQHGDLAIASVINPKSGRQFTATALSATEPLVVSVRNQDNQPATHYQIAYQVNNGAWQNQAFSIPVNGGSSQGFTLGSLNLFAVGDYHIKVALNNLSIADPVKGNDTIEAVLRQLANPALDLSNSFTEDFEGFPVLEVTGQSLMGIGHSDHWDFTADKPHGRIRSFINSGVTISGQRSISLDNAINEADSISESSLNSLTGTFNLSAYQADNDEIRCSFDYFLSGVPKFADDNRVWIRGKDTDPWLPFYTYQIDTFNPGAVSSSGACSLNDVLLAGGQAFSSSTQIKLEQKDTSKIESPYYGNGLTADNFTLFRVRDDIAMSSVNSVFHYNCALSNAVPLTITIRNGVFNTVYNIAVSYQLDSQAVVSAIIDSLPGKDSMVYTFSTPMDLSALGNHQLSAWVYVPTDNYHLNDSINHFDIRNQPVIDSFPYLQNFEQNDGGFYTGGKNSSWQYGVPAAPKINHAASGRKAWKTNLTGTYNNLETSFLYSPCFDINGLQNPVLSFSLATDIEAPEETIYDRAYVEYTTDGVQWKRLGTAHEGYNWYNNDSAGAWTEPDETYWHVATISLPPVNGTISFRFVLNSDPGATYEGIAIDDIHVYDLKNHIFDEDSMLRDNSATIAAGTQHTFIENKKIALSLLNGNGALNKATVQDYGHQDFVNADSSQYFLPRNFTVKTSGAPSDSVLTRFFIPGDAMKKVRDDQSCYSCSKIKEVYQMGITQYSDPNRIKENNLLSDNKEGKYSFIPKNEITWVPYAKGYYAELKLKSFSEFWFNDGGPDGNQPLSARLFTFTASHLGNRYSRLSWQSLTDAGTTTYELQRADTSMQFQTIATFNSLHDKEFVYRYTDTPSLNSPYVFYRILHSHQDGSVYSSLIRRLDWSDKGGIVSVYPNPVRQGMLTIQWFKGSGAPLEWTLSNILGQKVITGKIEKQIYDGQETLNLGKMALSPGLYLLKIKSGREDWEFKIVFQ